MQRKHQTGGSVCVHFFAVHITCRHFLWGGTISLRIHLASGSGYWLSLSTSVRVLFPRSCICFSLILLLFFSHPFRSLSFVSFSLLQCAGTAGLLTCICCACRIQYDDMALHCLLSLLRYDVVSGCRSFVTTELDNGSTGRMENQQGMCMGCAACWRVYTKNGIMCRTHTIVE